MWSLLRVRALCLLYSVVCLSTVNKFCLADEDTCTKQQDTCPTCQDGQESFSSKIMLSASVTASSETVRAQDIIMEHAGDVISLVSPYTLTTSLLHFCCRTSEDRKTIVNTLLLCPVFAPTTLEYTGAVCMETDNDGTTIGVKLAENSESFLKRWIENVRGCLSDSGITVDERRDSLDMLLAVVKDSYPIDEVLPNLNGTMFSYTLNRYYVAGVIIRV